MLAAALLIASACTSNETLSTDDDSTRDRIITSIDEDGDGLAERFEFEFQLLIDDPNVVVGMLNEIEVQAHQVLTSLEESPPTLMKDPLNPEAEDFIARLTSMMRLRLVGAALTDLGFEVDLTGSDLEINDSIGGALATGFEEFAKEKTLRADPGIIKFASPHCITMIATSTEAEATQAAQRVLDGESARAVATEVNVEGATSEDGDLGCRPTNEWQALLGATGVTITELEPGEVSEPISIRSANSPTGELFVVVYLEEVKLEEADVDSLGPFADRVLQEQMTTYDVFVAPQLGTWLMDSLTIVLPTG